MDSHADGDEMPSTSMVEATAARGSGNPTPASLVIEDRYELLYLLKEAAELEHAACCAYLYAAFSLKSGADEGLTPDQLQTVLGWKRTVTAIAVQEMMHLTLACNLLTALGGAPHFDRPNFPQRTLYAPEIEMSLMPFSEAALERFLYIERPEGMDIADLAHDVDVGGPRLSPVAGGAIMPARQDFSSVGQLYRGIEQGLRRLVGRYGEARVFVGSPRAQATAQLFRYPERLPELTAVTDLASALRAVETIVVEGEGARGDWQEAHFGRFTAVLREYRALRAQDASFVPARPALENPYVRMPRGVESNLVQVHLLDDPATAAVSSLFNACYDAMLQLLNRFFAHTEESDVELALLCEAAVELMFAAIEPLGELLTTLPAGQRYPGMTAGPNFLVSRRTLLTAHKPAAWAVLQERLLELAEECARLTQPATAGTLGGVQRSLAQLAARLAPQPVAYQVP